MSRIERVVPALIASFLALVPSGQPEAGILGTSHNLSVSGPGSFKAVTEERVCVFCHVPHHANPSTPLWSRPTSSSVYDLYESTTLVAKPGQPSGSARLCLSCHDGTIALGALAGPSGSVTIDMAGGVTRLPVERASNLGGSTGKDLTNDHPISFPYTTELAQLNGELNVPSSLPAKIRLEQGGMLQCTACHNPHNNQYGKFLVLDNSSSALCIACHNISGFAVSVHGSAASMTAGCTLCHASHNAGGNQRLLKFAAEEQNCYQCHSNGGSAKDIKTVIDKFYNHPVAATTGIHDPKANPLTVQKHVECQDCHNAHEVKGNSAQAPEIPGVLYGVRGVSINGEVMAGDAVNEYEVCFRCHAENNFYGTQSVLRQIQELNTRLDFDPANPSYHPVAAIGKGSYVPSLRTSYRTTSMIYCKDCHSNDDPAQAKGPHGSSFRHILAARYETDTYPLTYSESNYALCWRCHDPVLLLDPTRSAFPKHQWHVVTQKVPCSVCHDSHGVPATRGASADGNARLINFDVRFVTSGSFSAAGKSCTVSCHSVNPRLY
ncbi:MAG: cytochrome C [Geobacter sp.]|nr:MAG: cytochrome C [Geobacter sp.]